jgi:cytochrome c556
MRSTILAAALAAVGLTAVSGGALADAADDAIKARRGYFTLLGVEFGPLVAMARGDADYDAAKAEAHAANLATLLNYPVGTLFVPGSANADNRGDTRALPVIWTDLEGFGSKAEGLQAAIAALQPRAGAGRGELGAAVQQIGAACKACHDDYRASDF